MKISSSFLGSSHLSLGFYYSGERVNEKNVGEVKVNKLERDFPRTFHAHRAEENLKNYDAWPFPGAEAKKASKTVASAAKVKAPVAQKPLSRLPERSISRLRLLQRSRANQKSVAVAGHESVNSSPAENNDNKEALMSGRSFSRDPGNSKRFLPDSRVTTTAQPKLNSDIITPVSQNSSLPEWLEFNNSSSQLPELEGRLTKENHPVTFAEPSCLRFHNVETLQLQMKKMKFHSPAIRICVPANTVPLFEYLFTYPLTDLGGKNTNIMASMVVNEIFPLEFKRASFNKFRGLNQMINKTSMNIEALGSDRICSLISLEVLPTRKLIDENIPGNEILAQNSFKIIRVKELDNTDRLFIAFFRYQSIGDNAINAGFHEIKKQWGQFIINDSESGLNFFSADIEEFIIGLERLTGLAFRPDANTLPRLETSLPYSQQERSVFTDARHIFIREEAAKRSRPPYGQIKIDNSLSFLSPVKIEAGPCDSAPVLYRNCYLLDGDCLRYVDDSGRPGRLEFLPVGTLADRQLVSPPFPEQSFLFQLGATAGKNYLLPEVIELLNAKNITPFNLNGKSPRILYSPGFYIESSESKHVDNDTETVSITGREHVSVWCGSCFSFRDGELQFSDHRARDGTLKFVAAKDKLQIASQNSSEALRFARDFGLKSNSTYSLNEIQDRLYARGMVQVPHEIV